MTILFLILIVLASVILGFIILVQNPKGGGLTGNVAGFGNQFMGVKQTTDVLEKGTWIFAGVIGLLCLASTLFMGGSTEQKGLLEKVNTSGVPVQQAPATQPADQPAQPAQQPAAPGQQPAPAQ
ncbi:MAG TPA: preprotein translocase subunit SecG [Phnomibacter sp.]|nr:preprotein translocase subunit SecG [Phnomibacter sp.]